MLAQYLEDEEARRTIPSITKQLEERMTRIKREAESLEYRELTDQAFQFQVASLCVAVNQFRLHIHEAERGVERFIENSFAKWRAYFELQQDLLRLLSLFSAQNTKGVECLNRVPKLEQASNFNVIKINTQTIDIQCTNKALVLPPNHTTPITHDQQQQPQLEFLQPGNVARESVLLRVRTTVESFQATQRKIRVYQSHYAKLGNKVVIKEGRIALHEQLDEVAYCIRDALSPLGLESCIINEIEAIKTCFDEMLAILDQECANCAEYAFNTISRFIECSTTYNRLLNVLRHHQISLDIL